MTTHTPTVPILRAFARRADAWEELADPHSAAGRSIPGRSAPGRPSRAGEARWLVVADPEDVLDAGEELGIDVEEVRGRLAQISNARPGAHPRVIRANDHALFVVVPTAAYAQEQVTTGRLVLLVTRSTILSAESGTARITEGVVSRVTERQMLRGKGPLPVVAAMLIELVARASDVELALGDAVSHLESLVFQRGADPMARLYNLKREIAEARRALMPLSVELPDLGDDHATSAVEPLSLQVQLLARLCAQAERIDRRLDSHDSLLSDMLTVRLSQISVQQNEDMRKISAWAAIAAVPTLVAGIYGMNFRHMPELGWSWGYPGTLVFMAGICGWLYWAFKRAGWL